MVQSNLSCYFVALSSVSYGMENSKLHKIPSPMEHKENEALKCCAADTIPIPGKRVPSEMRLAPPPMTLSIILKQKICFLTYMFRIVRHLFTNATNDRYAQIESARKQWIAKSSMLKFRERENAN